MAPTLSGGGPRLPPFPRCRRHVRVRLPPRLLRAHRQPGAVRGPRALLLGPQGLPRGPRGLPGGGSPLRGSPRRRPAPHGAGRLGLRSPLRRWEGFGGGLGAVGVGVRLSCSRDVPAAAFGCSYVLLTVVMLLVRTLHLAFVSSLGLTVKYFLKLFASSHFLSTVCLFFLFVCFSPPWVCILKVKLLLVSLFVLSL